MIGIGKEEFLHVITNANLIASINLVKNQRSAKFKVISMKDEHMGILLQSLSRPSTFKKCHDLSCTSICHNALKRLQDMVLS